MLKRFLVFLLTFVLSLAPLSGVFKSVPAGAGEIKPAGAEKSKSEVLEAYQKLPLNFIENKGQLNEAVLYYAKLPQGTIYFTGEKVVFQVVEKVSGEKVSGDTARLFDMEKKKPFGSGYAGSGEQVSSPDKSSAPSLETELTRQVSFSLNFAGANKNVNVKALGLNEGKVNYLIGNDPAKWHTNIPTYQEIVYRNLWPGIDLSFKGEQGNLKYELVVKPGARPETIKLAYEGIEGLELAPGGELLIKTTAGTLKEAKPYLYQEIAGEKVAVEGSFALAEAEKTAYGFAVAAYAPRYPLVIDPLVYSTYLGGSSGEYGVGIAVDGAGDAYVTGETASANFPTTSRAFDQSHNGNPDAFVTKLYPGPDITVAPLPVPFGDVLVGSSADQVVTVKNDGDADLNTGPITNPAGPFSIIADNVSNQTLAPGAEATLTVRFAPPATGPYNDSFGISSNDPDENPVTLNLNGNGIVAPDLTGNFTLLRSYAQGRAVMAKVLVQNIGNAPSGSFKIAFYISDDASFDPGADQFLWSRNVLGIGAGRDRTTGFFYKFRNSVSGKYLLNDCVFSFITQGAPAAGIASTTPTTLTEAAANDGSLASGTVTIIIANGTLATDIAKANVTATNLPVGLDYIVTRTDDTRLTINITGNAANHADANDVSNLKFTIAQAKITVAGSKGNLTVTCGPWNFDLVSSANGEVVVRVDWSAVANHLVTGVTAQEVAAAIAPKIYEGQNGQPPLSELPIHLIGHSRGGGMVYELARLLGEQGVEVNQVTSLDPLTRILLRRLMPRVKTRCWVPALLSTHN